MSRDRTGSGRRYRDFDDFARIELVWRLFQMIRTHDDIELFQMPEIGIMVGAEPDGVKPD